MLVGGAPLTGKVVIPGNAFENKQITVTADAGALAVGKLVSIGTSAPTSISSVFGSLDAMGKFTFTVGPSFGLKGDVTLTVVVGDKMKIAQIQYV